MEVSAKKAPLPYMPFEIIRYILLKLRVKSLIRSQCVCREWRSLIQDPDFKLSYCGKGRVDVISHDIAISYMVRSVTENLRIEKPFQFRGDLSFCKTAGSRLRFWGSCNGLVLLSANQHVLLWNPSIRSSVQKVFELRRLNDPGYDVVAGLCYDSSTGDYKAVFLFRHFKPDPGGRFVFVVSLRNKTRRLVPFPYNFLSARDGIGFHGTIHWMVSDTEPASPHYVTGDREWDNLSECNKIVYFDPECDEFRELPTPEPRHGGENSIACLGIIDDCLCMGRKEKQTGTIEVLVMKKYKIKESWVTKFFIPISKFGAEYFDLTFYSPKNISKVLFWSRDEGRLLIYDPEINKLNTFCCLKDSIYYECIVGICFNQESFASPHEFIWRDENRCADNMKWIEDR